MRLVPDEGKVIPVLRILPGVLQTVILGRTAHPAWIQLGLASGVHRLRSVLFSQFIRHSINMDNVFSGRIRNHSVRIVPIRGLVKSVFSTWAVVGITMKPKDHVWKETLRVFTQPLNLDP